MSTKFRLILLIQRCNLSERGEIEFLSSNNIINCFIKSMAGKYNLTNFLNFNFFAKR